MMTSVGSPSLGTDPTSALQLDPAWYDAIGVRRSRRRYSDRKVAKAALSALRSLLRATSSSPPGRASSSSRTIASCTQASSTESAAPTAASRAPRGWRPSLDPRAARSRSATSAKPSSWRRRGWGSAPVGWPGMFDREAAAEPSRSQPGEQVLAVTPVGHPRRTQAVRRAHDERRGALRRPPPDRADRSRAQPRALGPGRRARSPAWAVTAVEAARLAPSGANGQPWRFRLEHGALVMSAPRRPTGRRPSTTASPCCTSNWAPPTKASTASGSTCPTPTSRASSPSRSHQRDGSRIAVCAWRSQDLTLTLDLSMR